MWRFFAFIMIILMILMFIQVSTISDEDKARVHARLEAARNEKPQTSMPVMAKTDEAVETIEADALLELPPVRAYENFLNAIPNMQFYSEVENYINPKLYVSYRNRLNQFSGDKMKIVKDAHDISRMEYMDVRTGNDQVMLIYIASSKLMKDLAQVVEPDEQQVEGLMQGTVKLSKISGNWFIDSENWERIPEKFELRGKEIDGREQRLAEYYRMRKAR